MGTIILVVVVIVMVGIFALQNAAQVSISFLSLHFDASLAVIALLFSGRHDRRDGCAVLGTNAAVGKKEEISRTRSGRIARDHHARR